MQYFQEIAVLPRNCSTSKKMQYFQEKCSTSKKLQYFQEIAVLPRKCSTSKKNAVILLNKIPDSSPHLPIPAKKIKK
jgi:hypothetical protein